eukprot:SAG31_NODE_932_length_10913_cov_3.933235_15_plen_170_part_00
MHCSARKSQVNIDYPGTDRFPNFTGSRPLQVTVKAGDLLYIPPFWPHHVVYLGGNDADRCTAQGGPVASDCVNRSEAAVSLSVFTPAAETAVLDRLQSLRLPGFEADWPLAATAAALHRFVLAILSKLDWSPSAFASGLLNSRFGHLPLSVQHIRMKWFAQLMLWRTHM